MRKLIHLPLAALALAAPAAAGRAPLVVAMHDPGCHWFYVGGKYVKSVTRHGPVTLLNQDEAALRVKGPGGTKLERVGAKLTLRARGTYRITMVRQAPDDNHLTLTVNSTRIKRVGQKACFPRRAFVVWPLFVARFLPIDVASRGTDTSLRRGRRLSRRASASGPGSP